MAKPDEVLWDYEEHTRAKHRLLVRYLQAWLPIMAARNTKLNLIDGFAGPGRYKGGETGSPLLMLDAYLDHRARPQMEPLELTYIFIEKDRRRAEYLSQEVSRRTLPGNVHVEVVNGEFDAVMSHVLDRLPASQRLAPTFAFIDPFGYTGHGLKLSSRILAFGKCEVLIYVPLPFIARFINEPGIEQALTNLFGDDSWKESRGKAGRAAKAVLHRLFLERVRRAAGFARAFEIDAADSGWRGYELFFGTGNVVGLAKFKEAMWAVDPAEGARFADSTDPSQMTLFSGPDPRQLERMLAARFGGAEFSIEEAERFVTLETSYAAGLHLKTKTLKSAETAGRLDGRHPSRPRRRGTYPPGTMLRFKQPRAGDR